MASFKKSIWFSSNYSTSLGRQKERETEREKREGGFRTRWVSEKGLKASVKYGGSWHTQVLSSILHSHKILQLQMTWHATVCLAAPLTAGVLVVTCQLPPLRSFISSPLTLIDYLSNARLKLNPCSQFTVRGEQWAAGIGTHLIKCKFPCLACAIGLISQP